MENHNIRLTSTEIAGLWATYIQDSMALCYLTYFQHHTKDEQISDVIAQAIELSQTHIRKITSFFTEENFPVPNGFSEKEVRVTTPPLYYDLFSLSFVYGMSKIGLATHANITTTVARRDMVKFFGDCVVEAKELYQASVEVMLNKGIYDRPPKIPYPKEVSYVSDTSYAGTLLGSNRSLNVAELTELFFQIERNYFASMLLTGFEQVVKDKEIKKYFKKGHNLAEKQIKIYNEILHHSGMQGNIPVSLEVTDSTVAPFSDKLMLYLINSLNSVGIHYLGHALSTSMRKDLGVKYVRLLPEMISYGEDGLDLLIDRGWFEQPPQSVDRDKLINSKK